MNSGQSSVVLVVDDDEAFRQIAGRILRDAGYRALEAATGEEALRLARHDPPEVVVLDVRLRGSLTGHQVCRLLKDELSPAPSIVLISGARTESYDRVGGLLVGADDYVIKPFAADELLARVHALIRRRPTRAKAAGQFTSRQKEVIRLLRSGLGRDDIARTLEITPAAATKEINLVLTKLGG